MSFPCERRPSSSPAAPTSPSRSRGPASSGAPRTRRWPRVEPHQGDFAAEGVAARIRLARAGVAADAFEALDNGDREAALDGLLEAIGDAEGETREDLRRAAIGILSEGDQADPAAREYRRRLATALY